MKKVLSTVLSTAMLLSLAGCSSKETGKYTAGTYAGSGKGHSSDVKVTATFSASEITKVELDVSGETESIVKNYKSRSWKSSLVILMV